MDELDLHLMKTGGATTWTALHRDGIDGGVVARALHTGRLRRVRRNAYIDGAVATRGEKYRLSSIAVARSRPGCALSHANALVAHGLPVTYDDSRRYHLIGPTASGLTEMPSKDVIVRPLDVPVVPLVDHVDVSAVPAEVAVVQVAALRQVRTAVVAGDALLRRGVPREALETAITQAVGPRGRGRATRVVALFDGRSESPGESLLRLGLQALDVTTVPQVELFDELGFVPRVDLLDEAARVVYEFDGLTKYAGAHGREALAAEKRREDRIRRLGYRVSRVTWADLDPVTLHHLSRPPRQQVA